MILYTDFDCVNIQTKARNAITHHKNICFSSSFFKETYSVIIRRSLNFNIKYVFRPSYSVGLDSEKRIFSEQMRKEGKRGY